MAFQKILTLTLETATSAKMVEYVDLFIRSFGVNEVPMTNAEKETFIKQQFFRMLKTSIKNQSIIEKQIALAVEDVDATITGV